MKFLIDKLKLKLLLEEKKDYINHPISGIDTVITAVIYMVSLLCSDFKEIFGINKYIIRTLSWVLAVAILLYGIRQIWKSFRYKYDHHTLFTDIENLNEILHRFSIVAIKDSFCEFPNRFLLYYDDVWNCWFFLNFHTSEYQNEQNISQRISNQLKIDTGNIMIKYIADRMQPKYSERDKINKIYQHSLYQAIITEFPPFMKADEFTIEGIKYKWWTISDMEKDPEIWQKNNDVISFVKEKI